MWVFSGGGSVYYSCAGVQCMRANRRCLCGGAVVAWLEPRSACVSRKLARVGCNKQLGAGWGCMHSGGTHGLQCRQSCEDPVRAAQRGVRQ